MQPATMRGPLSPLRWTASIARSSVRAVLLVRRASLLRLAGKTPPDPCVRVSRALEIALGFENVVRDLTRVSVGADNDINCDRNESESWRCCVEGDALLESFATARRLPSIGSVRNRPAGPLGG